MNPSPEPDILERILELACSIQQIPAPTFHEEQRARWIADRLGREKLDNVGLDEVGNVYARLPSAAISPNPRPLIVAAHLDTVFPLDVSLAAIETPERISGPGIGDNSLGLASLFGLIWMLRRRRTQLPGDLWLVGTVGEEGLGDLRGMRAAVDRFCQPQSGQSPLGFIIVEGMGVGEIFYRGLGVRRYRIRCETPGGHSWIDYGRPSAVHELARMAFSLVNLPISRQPRSSLNIGVISGGTSINTIAAWAELELDLRSEDPLTLESNAARVLELVSTSGRKDVRFSAEVIGSRPGGEIPFNHPLVQLARDALLDVGIQPDPGIGSTDANIPLSRGIPAVCIGMTRGAGAHTTGEYILTRPLNQGLEQLFQIVTRAWKEIK